MEEEGLPPRPTYTKLGSLSPASLPKAWALLPASFRYISFNTQKNQQRLHSYFLASRCCHLCTKGAAPCLCLRVLRGPF